MGLLAAILALAIPPAVEANPPQHFMQSGGETEGPSEPAYILLRMNETARILHEHGQTASRIALYDMAWPATPAEYEAVGHNGIIQISVAVADGSELPLRNVRVHTATGDIVLKPIAIKDQPVAKDSLLAQTVGPFRQDCYYLLPAGLALQRGSILIDYARNRSDFALAQLPLQPLPFHTDARPARPANPDAVAAFLHREYPDSPTLLPAAPTANAVTPGSGQG